ncbi:MAG TPA: rubrerythrin, partial [Brevundimonas sp.]|nr:rubrerythrin [Brevundimonas sp.]
MTLKALLTSTLVALALSAGAAAAQDLAPQTRANLEAAMHGEAFANLKYLRYAEVARESGDEELARLFESSANVEANEHFAREADALK